MNLVIFDFCETIYKFQSANRFVDFCLEKLNKKSVYYRFLSYLSSNMLIIKVLAKIFPSYNFSKRVKLFTLRRVNQIKLSKIANEFYEELLINLNGEVVSMLENHINEGDHVIIVSGGYWEYLHNFKSLFKIKAVIATKISFRHGKCKGYFYGKDCMFKEKINMIQDYIYNSKIKYKKSICYTDSISDLSLLKWVEEPIVISNLTSQKWPQDYGFREIIINKKRTCYE